MEKNRTFVLCDGSETNSQGFRIEPEGMDLRRFEKNPVMLYRHNSEDVIGRWENLRIESGRLLADAVWDMEDDTAKRVAGRVERGFLRGCSVGVIIGEMMETVPGLYVATRTELLEASICAIPSDSGAVVLYDKNRKQLTLDQVKLQFINNQKKEEMDEKEKLELEQSNAQKDKEIAELRAALAESKKREVAAFLSAAEQSGKITDREKPGFAKLSELDFDTVKSIIESRESKQGGSLREMQMQAAAAIPTGREAWTYLEWMKKDSEGLKRMKTDNPREFERLRQTVKSIN